MGKEDRYWQCRRSLRIWPINGADVRTDLRDFLKTKPRLGPIFLSDMGELSVKRVPAAPTAKITREVITIFSTVEIRDAVRRAAKELAGLSDAGIRLEIPYFLQPEGA